MEKTIDYAQLEEERRMEQVKNPIPEILVPGKQKKDKLKIAYVMRFCIVNGGTKIIFECANRLAERGHEIYLICHDERPTWFPLNDSIKYIHVDEDKVLCEAIPKDVDLIVSSTNKAIYEAIMQRIAPVIYFEQGSAHLFNRQELDETKIDFISREYAVCNHIQTVSEYTRQKIQEYYHKDAYVIPNAVDRGVFYDDGIRKTNSRIVISAMGPDEWEFKGLQYIIEAVQKLKKNYDIDFYWISPREPSIKIDTTYVNPPQNLIGEVLRKSDIFISASAFESFCLPVLEAMTCGAAVICTNAGGNMEFSIDNETCLLINKRDVDDIVSKTEQLINKPELREKLSQNAKNKASEYSWDNTIDKMEEYYKEVATYTVGE